MWGARAKRSAGGLLIALCLALTGCGAELAQPKMAGRATGTTEPYAAPAPTGPPTVASSEPPSSEPSTAPPISSPPPSRTPTPTVAPSTSVAPPPKLAQPVPVVVTKSVVVVKSVAFKKKNVRDPDRPEGEKAVTTRGVKGKKELTYAVTYTDGRETGRRLVREVVTVRPVTQITSIGTKQESSGGGCDPNYTGCVPIASDVDCAGGSGNGPAYVAGPVEVIGSDIYRLDADHDGIGCEDG
ncbi:G5 domain-containing protein [Kribbella sp. NPDC051718]|uniref:G5 domain-containing protein n=1 Tax=Kribbella sp. NPDC051718 TaxID=3155168 RepID=UPI00343BE6B5